MKPYRYQTVEPLESRIAPAGLVTATLVGGKLTLVGDAASNTFEIETTATGLLTLTGSGGTTIALNGAAAAGVVATSLPIAEIVAKLGTGDDALTGTALALSRGFKFDGGAGADTLTLNDTRVQGTVTVLGGAGVDGFVAGAAFFEAGKLVVDLGADAGAATVNASSATIASDLTFKGGAANDVLQISSDSFRAGGSVRALLGNGDNTYSSVVGTGSIDFAVGGSLIIDHGANYGTAKTNLGGVRGIATGNIGNFSIGGDLRITAGGAGTHEMTTQIGIGQVAGKTILTGKGGNDDIISVTGRFNFGKGLEAKLGGGTNTLRIDAATSMNFASIKYQGGDGDDAPSLGVGEVLTVSGAADFVVGAGVNNVSFFCSGGHVFTAGAVKVAGGGGTDNVFITATTFLASRGVTASLADGANDFTLRSDRSVLDGPLLVTSGASGNGTATFEVDVTEGIFRSGVSATFGSGPVDFDFVATEALTVIGKMKVATSGGGTDDFNFDAPELTVTGLLEIKGGGATNRTGIDSAALTLGALKVVGGAGLDTLTVTGGGLISGPVEVQQGVGSATLTISGSGLGLVLGGGLKHVSNAAGADTDSLALLRVTSAGAITSKLGNGVSNVLFNDVVAAGIVSIETGAGADNVDFEAANSGIVSLYQSGVRILLGDGIDTVDLGVAASALGKVEFQAPLFIDGGAGADDVNENNVVLSGAGVVVKANIP